MKRLTRVLLAICSVSVTTTLALALYLFFQWSHLAQLRGQLLAENELQSELLADQELDQAVIPHFSPEVGFVLNPYLKQATLWGFEGEAYPINWLGLRGPDIKPKRRGTKRILLVGDSILFGWHLKDEDRLSEILNRRVAQAPAPRNRIEFVTIALPGWNVRSEIAFLERHIRHLDPDAIVWWAIPNDIEDVAGVIPPGRLASWASTQKEDESPFAMLSAFFVELGAFVPLIAEKQADNIARVEAFHAEYDVPLFLIGFPGFEVYASESGFDPARVEIPPELFRDPRWTRTPTDGHPSPWANRQLATGLLHELARGGVFPYFEMDAEEAAIGKAFELRAVAMDSDPAAEKEASDPDPGLVSEQLWGQIPDEFSLQDRDRSALYGVDKNARMAKTGAIVLRGRRERAEQSVTIRLELPANMSKYPGQSTWTIQDRFGGVVTRTIAVGGAELEFELPVPDETKGDAVFQISWSFDYAICDTSSRCWSARLLGAEVDS